MCVLLKLVKIFQILWRDQTGLHYMYRLDSNCTRQLVKLVRNFGFKFILIVGMSVWESTFCSIITVYMYKLQLEFECSNTYAGSLYMKLWILHTSCIYKYIYIYIYNIKICVYIYKNFVSQISNILVIDF